MNLVNVSLRGELGELFGESWRLAVSSPAEAVRAIEANTRKFYRHLATAHERGVAFQVLIDGAAVDKDGLNNPVGSGDITFIPVLQGSKEQGIAQVIIGIVIIVVATIASQGSLTGPAISATFGGGGVAAFAASFGLAMALGGIATMIAGTPKQASLEERPEQRPSYQFNGPTNRTRQGNVVPVLYGMMIVGSQRVSGGVTNEDYVMPSSDSTVDPGGGDDPFQTGTGETDTFDPTGGHIYGGYYQDPSLP